MRRTRRLGRYHLIHRIAFGGMAEVFRGFTFSAEGERYDVAVKKLLPHYLEEQHFVTMLTDEYRLVSRLEHPNVAGFYELTKVGRDVLISMEYVDGKDLRSTLEKAKESGEHLRFDDAAYVLSRALDGLHHAHEATDEGGEGLQVVHRDLSPSNILLAYDGEVKICDFGIAKAKLSRIQTRAGIIKGKVKYMSPEQAFGYSLDRRSDVFSAGSILYELCTGQTPFRARTELDLIFAVRDASPIPCLELDPEIPRELVAIIERAMKPARSDRFQTSLEMRDALLQFLQRHTPNYRRTRLARFMKRIWAQEIDADLRALEDVVVDLSSGPEALGTNLLAKELGPDAVYAGFSPIPTSVGGRISLTPHPSSTRLDTLAPDAFTPDGLMTDCLTEEHPPLGDLKTTLDPHKP